MIPSNFSDLESMVTSMIDGTYEGHSGGFIQDGTTNQVQQSNGQNTQRSQSYWKPDDNQYYDDLILSANYDSTTSSTLTLNPSTCSNVHGETSKNYALLSKSTELIVLNALDYLHYTMSSQDHCQTDQPNVLQKETQVTEHSPVTNIHTAPPDSLTSSDYLLQIANILLADKSRSCLQDLEATSLDDSVRYRYSAAGTCPDINPEDTIDSLACVTQCDMHELQSSVSRISTSSHSPFKNPTNAALPSSTCQTRSGARNSLPPSLASNALTRMPISGKKGNNNRIDCKCPNCSVEGGNRTRNSKGILQHNCHIPNCGRTYKWPSELKIHLDWHRGDKKFSCPLCNRGFAWKSNLEKHIKLHSVVEQEGREIQKRQSTMCKCPYCNVEGGNQTMDCDGKLLHLCHFSDCGKIFIHPSSLKLHLNWHRGERKYICSYCDKKYVWSSNLQKHLKIHMTDERNKPNIN